MQARKPLFLVAILGGLIALLAWPVYAYSETPGEMLLGRDMTPIPVGFELVFVATGSSIGSGVSIAGELGHDEDDGTQIVIDEESIASVDMGSLEMSVSSMREDSGEGLDCSGWIVTMLGVPARIHFSQQTLRLTSARGILESFLTVELTPLEIEPDGTTVLTKLRIEARNPDGLVAEAESVVRLEPHFSRPVGLVSIGSSSLRSSTGSRKEEETGQTMALYVRAITQVSSAPGPFEGGGAVAGLDRVVWQDEDVWEPEPVKVEIQMGISLEGTGWDHGLAWRARLRLNPAPRWNIAGEFIRGFDEGLIRVELERQVSQGLMAIAGLEKSLHLNSQVMVYLGVRDTVRLANGLSVFAGYVPGSLALGGGEAGPAMLEAGAILNLGSDRLEIGVRNRYSILSQWYVDFTFMSGCGFGATLGLTKDVGSDAGILWLGFKGAF
jgi:hypothetical protein